jgi:hypothetical protein
MRYLSDFPLVTVSYRVRGRVTALPCEMGDGGPAHPVRLKVSEMIFSQTDERIIKDPCKMMKG